MRPFIEDLLAKAASDRPGRRIDAYLTLIALVKKSRASIQDEYQRMFALADDLPWKYKFIVIQEAEKREIAATILDIFRAGGDEDTHSLWIFEFLGIVGFPYLLKIIKKHYLQFHTGQIDQANESVYVSLVDHCLKKFETVNCAPWFRLPDDVRAEILDCDIAGFMSHARKTWQQEIKDIEAADRHPRAYRKEDYAAFITGDDGLSEILVRNGLLDGPTASDHNVGGALR